MIATVLSLVRRGVIEAVAILVLIFVLLPLLALFYIASRRKADSDD